MVLKRGDLYRATPAVLFLIRRTSPILKSFMTNKEYEGPIITRIPMGLTSEKVGIYRDTGPLKFFWSRPKDTPFSSLLRQAMGTDVVF